MVREERSRCSPGCLFPGPYCRFTEAIERWGLDLAFSLAYSGIQSYNRNDAGSGF